MTEIDFEALREDPDRTATALWTAFKRCVREHSDGVADLYQLSLDLENYSQELRQNLDDTVYALAGRSLTSLIEEVMEPADETLEDDDGYEDASWS